MNSKNKNRLGKAGSLIFTVLLVGLSGCATIINGTTQAVSFTTKPEGAAVKAGEGMTCQTPCKLTLARKQDHAILINKEGYEDASLTIQHVISGAVAGNIIAGGLIGWGIDAISGGQYKLVPEAVSLELKPLRVVERPGLFFEKMKELEVLRNSGTINDEEYQKLRTQLLEDFNKK